MMNNDSDRGRRKICTSLEIESLRVGREHNKILPSPSPLTISTHLNAYFFALRSRRLRTSAPSELTTMRPPSTAINIVLKSMFLLPSSGCSLLVCQGFFLGLLLHNMSPPPTGSRSIKSSFVCQGVFEKSGIESLRAQRNNLCPEKRLLRRLRLLAMTAPPPFSNTLLDVTIARLLTWPTSR